MGLLAAAAACEDGECAYGQAPQSRAMGCGGRGFAAGLACACIVICLDSAVDSPSAFAGMGGQSE